MQEITRSQMLRSAILLSVSNSLVFFDSVLAALGSVDGGIAEQGERKKKWPGNRRVRCRAKWLDWRDEEVCDTLVAMHEWDASVALCLINEVGGDVERGTMRRKPAAMIGRKTHHAACCLYGED